MCICIGANGDIHTADQLLYRESMASLIRFIILLWAATVGAKGQIQPPISPEPEIFTCEPITDIRVCANVGYDNATFPNFRSQSRQSEADFELNSFIPLIQTFCSNAIVHMLCAVYAPFCQEGFNQVRPCKHLCEYVRDGCEERLNELGMIDWPPHLECDRYPTSTEDPTCFAPPEDELAGVEIPPIEGVILTPPTDPPTGDTNTTTSSSETTASQTGPTTQATQTTDPNTDATTMQSGRNCPPPLRVTSNIRNESYSFAGLDDCATSCRGIYFTDSQRNAVAPVLVLLFAILCVFSTLFTVATFLIDRRRFHYPERPSYSSHFATLSLLWRMSWGPSQNWSEVATPLSHAQNQRMWRMTSNQKALCSSACPMTTPPTAVLVVSCSL